MLWPLLPLRFFLSLIIGVLFILGPNLPANAFTFTVNSLADSRDDVPGDRRCADENGLCTLRAAVEEANAQFGNDTIEFSVEGTIRTNSELILSNDGTLIDADGKITLRGKGTAETDHVGFYITSKGNTIKGFAIQNFYIGVHIFSSVAFGNAIQNNKIGTNMNGLSAQANGVGVRIENAPSNTIGSDGNEIDDENEGNVISGNKSMGIDILFSNGRDNVIAANIIGLNAEGTAAIPNERSGITIRYTAHDNVIGTNGEGSTAKLENDRNIISGNGGYGVSISTGSHHNIVAGNYIGTDKTGLVGLPNTSGIQISGVDHDLWRTSHNRIGTDGLGSQTKIAAERNIIAGHNKGDGITLTHYARHNNIWGNYIGVGADGKKIIAVDDPLVTTQSKGIRLRDNAHHNQIGPVGETDTDIASAKRNIISGHTFYGVMIGQGAHDNQIAGNYIGLAADGTTEVRNQIHGIYILQGAINNIIGGELASESNIIAYNGSLEVAFNELIETEQGEHGIYVHLDASDQNKFLRNSFFGNFTSAIGLAGDGAHENLPAPIELELAKVNDNQILLSGSAKKQNGDASTNALIQVYQSDCTTTCQGKTYAGKTNVKNDSDEWNFIVPFPFTQAGTRLIVNQTGDDEGTGPFSTEVVVPEFLPTFSGFTRLLAVEDTPLTISYDLLMQSSNAVDANGDAISFRIEEIGRGTLTNNGVRLVKGDLLSKGQSFSWAPPAHAHGTLTAFRILAVTDTGNSSFPVNVDIFVTPVNDAPVLANPGTYGIDVGSRFVLNLIASDTDGDTLTFSSSNLPQGARLSPNGVFEWIPNSSAVGEHRIEFTVNDGQTSVSQTAVFTVNQTFSTTPSPLELTALIEGKAFVLAGRKISFKAITAENHDSNGLTYLWNIEGNATIEGAASLPGLTLQTHQPGQILVRVTISDGVKLSNASLTLTVIADQLSTEKATRINQEVHAVSGSGATIGQTMETRDRFGEILVVNLPNDIDFLLPSNAEIKIEIQGDIVVISDQNSLNKRGQVWRIDTTQAPKTIHSWDNLTLGVNFQRGDLSDQLGHQIRLVDLNNDNVFEILVHAPGSNKVFIYDNQLQNVLSTIDNVGQAIFMVIEDLDGNSLKETIIGNKGTSNPDVSSILSDSLAIVKNQFSGPDTSEVKIFFGADDLDPALNVASDSDQRIKGDDPFFSSDAGDINGDGFNDLVIMSLDACVGFIFFGKSNFNSISTNDANIVIEGADCQDQFGFHVSVGDLNGDGFEDIIIVARTAGADRQGKLHVIFGSNDLSSTILLDDHENHVSVTGSFKDGLLGDSLLLADVTGDGLLDILASEQTDEGTSQAVISFGSINSLVSSGDGGSSNNNASVGGSGCSINRVSPFPSSYPLWALMMFFFGLIVIKRLSYK